METDHLLAIKLYHLPLPTRLRLIPHEYSQRNSLY